MATPGARLAWLVALAAALLVLLGLGNWWLNGAPFRAREFAPAAGRAPPAVSARDAAEGDAPAAARAVRASLPREAAAEVVATADATALGVVTGSVCRQRDGTRVTEGTVALVFVPLPAPLDRAAYLARTEEERVELHEFDEAPIAADGTFMIRLPAPAIVRRAVLRPRLQGNAAAQFLETEQPLDELDLTLERPLALDLRVDDGAAIEGRVVAAAGGFPLRDARVEIPWWSDDWSDWACVTDLDGRFRVAGIRREVAGAQSHSEAIVRCAGYVTERFEVPPAGPDLDVHDLEFALQAGVAVTALLLPPTELGADEREAWRRRLASATLRLLPADAKEGPLDLAVVAWRARAASTEPEGDGFRVRFEEIPATRDVVLVGQTGSGGPFGPLPLDGSLAREPQPLIVALPPEPDGIALDTGIDRFEIQLQAEDGAPLALTEVAFSLGGRVSATARATSDAAGRFFALRPDAGHELTLRIARYRTLHLVALGARDSAEVSTRSAPLVLTPKRLARSRR